MPPQMPGVNTATLKLILQQLYPLCPLPPLSLDDISRILPALHQASGSTSTPCLCLRLKGCVRLACSTTSSDCWYMPQT
jgi:hypothetical protein